ncbi:MAG: alpha-amylase, partial [Sphingobacteriales bacterium]
MRYTTNHDVTSSDGSTIEIYKGKQGALAAFVLAACMDGVPLLYNGQEVGSPKKINFFIKDPIDWSTNPDMVQAYKQILNVRASSEAIKTGTLTAYNHTDIVAFEKKAGAEAFLVLVNVRNTAKDFQVPAALAGTSWKDQLTNASLTMGTSITLPAFGYLM